MAKPGRAPKPKKLYTRPARKGRWLFSARQSGYKPGVSQAQSRKPGAVPPGFKPFHDPAPITSSISRSPGGKRPRQSATWGG